MPGAVFADAEDARDLCSTTVLSERDCFFGDESGEASRMTDAQPQNGRESRPKSCGTGRDDRGR